MTHLRAIISSFLPKLKLIIYEDYTIRLERLNRKLKEIAKLRKSKEDGEELEENQVTIQPLSSNKCSRPLNPAPPVLMRCKWKEIFKSQCKYCVKEECSSVVILVQIVNTFVSVRLERYE